MVNINDSMAVSGTTASFNTPRQTEVESVKISFEPKQDLNGYDNAWAGGFGKNIWNPDIQFSDFEGYQQIHSSLTRYSYKFTDTDADYVISFRVKDESVDISGVYFGFMWKSDDIYEGYNWVIHNGSSTGRYTNTVDTPTAYNTRKCMYVTIYPGTEETYNKLISKYDIQIEAGTTSTSFVLYENLCPITQWDGLKAYHTGKNMLDVSADTRIVWTGTYGNFTQQDGVVITSGNILGGYKMPCLPNTTYTYRWDPEYNVLISKTLVQRVWFLNNDQITYKSYTQGENTKTTSFTTPADCYCLVTGFYGYSSASSRPFKIRDMSVELGSAATAYESYHGEVFDVDWAALCGDVAGGEYDVVSGELQRTWYCYTITGQENFYDLNTWVTMTIPNEAYPTTKNRNVLDGKCSHLGFRPYSRGCIGVMYNERTVTFDGNIMDAAGWKQYCLEQYQAGTPVQIAYKLKSPVNYSLTPRAVTAYAKTNIFWVADTDTEVTYRLIKTYDAMPSRQNIMMDSPHVETVSGVIANFSTDMASDVKDLKVYFEPIQYGIGNPSPDNVRELKARNSLQLYSYGENKGIVTPGTTTSLGVTWTINQDGSIDYDGIPTSYSSIRPMTYYVRGGETVYGVITGDKMNVTFNYAAIVCKNKDGTSRQEGTSDSQLGLGIDMSEYSGAHYISTSLKRYASNTYMHGRCFLTIDDKPIDINEYTIINQAIGKNLFDKSDIWTLDNFIADGETFSNSKADTSNTLLLQIATYDDNGRALQYFQQQNVGIGKFSITCTITKPCARCAIRHSGATVNVGIHIPWRYLGTYTISFDVVNNDVKTVGGLVIQNIQIEEGSQATEFEPFNNTCYGGYIDFTTGEFVKEYDCITFTGNENWNYNRTVTTLGVEKHELYSNALDSVAAFDTPSKCKSNMAVTHSGDNRAADISIGFGTPSYAFFVSINSSLCDGTADSFKAYLSEHPLQVVYPLKTPVRYQITPYALKTLKGINNVWSNGGGTVEISYLKRGEDSVQRLPMQGYTTDDNYVIITSDGYTIGEEEDYIEY